MSASDIDRDPAARSARDATESGSLAVASIALAALIAVYLIFALGSAAQKSVTVDELGHLPSGLYTVMTGDVRHASLNPPLANVLSSVPVFALKLDRALEPPVASDDVFSFWSTGYHFLDNQRADYIRIFEAARVVPIALVAGLGLLLFAWGRQLVPDAPQLAGLLAAGLVLASPNVIAQARLVGTDTTTACFVTLAVYAFRAMLLRPDTARVLMFAVALGLAQLTKFYALLLYPTLLGLVFVWHALSDDDGRERSGSLRGFAAAVAVSLLVLNAGYLFAESGASLRDLSIQSELLGSWQASSLGGVPLPVPGAFVRAIDGQLVEVSSGLRSFLLGESFQGGRWDYYLVILAIKTPLVYFATFGLAMVAAFRGVGASRRESVLLLGYPLVLVLFLSLSGSRQLGARALLSAVPFVQLWVAAACIAHCPVRWRNAFTASILGACIAVSAIAYPNYLSYFNAFVGGSGEAYRAASDANIDIGQDLPALASYLEEVDAGTVQLFYFGSVDPALYGIDYEVPRDYQLKPGYLAISVSLYRMSYELYDHGELRRMGPVDVSTLGEPVAQIGGSIHVYRIPALGPPSS